MTVALIVAAGSGERLGAPQPKALVELGGRALVQWSIDALRELAGEIESIVVAMPAGAHAPAGVIAVEGGAVRSESVRRALAAAPGGERAGRDELVLVHDAARPLVSADLAREVIGALRADPHADAAIAATPVTDTVKRVDRTGAVVETLQRSELWAVQTPQVFRRAALARALDVPAPELARATDDAWLIERAGGKVIVVAASDENIKVTTSLDLRVAELLLAERRPSSGASPAPPAGAPGRA
jgi:2-C-methyl-D-erythritol 4-phosphate cytidylyltransferase